MSSVALEKYICIAQDLMVKKPELPQAAQKNVLSVILIERFSQYLSSLVSDPKPVGSTFQT
jgi:hypothetical protein